MKQWPYSTRLAAMKRPAVKLLGLMQGADLRLPRPLKTDVQDRCWQSPRR
jgi:hypothetical protein